MLFGTEMIDAIAALRKNVTRRPWKQGDQIVWQRNETNGGILTRKVNRETGSGYQLIKKVLSDTNYLRFSVGGDCAVQPGRGLSSVSWKRTVMFDAMGRSYNGLEWRPEPFFGAEKARIQLLQIHMEPLGHLTDDDAIAEGFKSTGHFFDYWRHLYGRVNEQQNVYAIGFVPVISSVEPIYA